MVGFTKPLSTVCLADKDETIVTFHLFIKVKLTWKVAGLLQHMKKYYDLMTSPFVNERSSLVRDIWSYGMFTSPIVYTTQSFMQVK